ncbi:MAG TPA: DsrE family protein [Nitrososphaeraceae archaeon]|jgi:predicted peroxiredoxin|nr:DsrE family protein [Nitrososphaeraceae archaeon]
MKKYSLMLLFSSIIIGISFLSGAYGQNDFSKTISKNANPIVYHLTSNDPWRASIVISDATNLKNLGYNVTLLLSIEGVQVGVKNPHHHLNLDNVVANVTNFIKAGGKVVVCGICLRVAGFETNEILDGAIIGNHKITPKLFTNATVVTY